MLSEHVVLGPDAAENGVMGNPRAYAMPGNQDPFMPWPSSIVLLAAIASATSRIRLVASAILAPLRHPLLLARELGTLDLISQGRLVVQPSVSWSRDEYAALGVPFAQRGRILDEQLAILAELWKGSPTSFHGRYFSFDDCYLEPRAFRDDGPRLWFGGQSAHGAVCRRLAAYGHGWHPLGMPSGEDFTAVRQALQDVGRDADELEIVGGVRATFPDDTSCAPLGPAIDAIGPQLDSGFTTICIKPSQFIDDSAEMSGFCRDVVRRVDAVSG
jgi:alkanesulfonate monooxygenase SsuD/methylene tetrahydromethanopterin reductase-like flavin-dependent oxidoreductase (luciferase family)